MDYYRIPELIFRLRPQLASAAFAVTVFAALAGTGLAIRRGVRLPPAQAMRPEPPPVYRVTMIERLGLQRLLAPTTRMILRQLERRPVRALMTTLGIALATGIVVSGMFFPDSMDFIVDAQFQRASREDLAVTFVENRERAALFELAALPGVRHAEPYRSVAVRLRHGHRERRTSLLGFLPGMEMHRVLDENLEAYDLPPQGLVLSDILARALNVVPGDTVTLETLQGRRRTYETNVVAAVEQWIGMSAYMDLDAMNAMLDEGDVISGAFLAVPRDERADVLKRLERRPMIAGVRSQRGTIESWRETFEEVMLTFVGFIGALSGAITLGVVYNAARINLAERARELASLRVLGLTRAEVSYILLGELALLVLLAVPLGFGIGFWLAQQWAAQAPQELFKLPVIISTQTLALAAATVLVAAFLSSLVVLQRIRRLDLVGVLKTPE
jgi:putative ABC transport system permease protein